MEKHKKGLPPASQWNVLHKDVNKDGIPDVIIRNSNGQPLYVNGYTTRKSDHPMRYEFYKTFPTSEGRKGKTIDKFAKQLFNISYDDENENFNNLGDVATYKLPDSWAQYKFR